MSQLQRQEKETFPKMQSLTYYTIMDDVSFFPNLETRLELQHNMGTIWSNKIKQWFKYQQHKKQGGFSKT